MFRHQIHRHKKTTRRLRGEYVQRELNVSMGLEV